MDSKNALKTWEMANSIENINSIDEIYRYDKRQQQDILTAKPWDKEYLNNYALMKKWSRFWFFWGGLNPVRIVSVYYYINFCLRIFYYTNSVNPEYPNQISVPCTHMQALLFIHARSVSNTINKGFLLFKSMYHPFNHVLTLENIQQTTMMTV